MDAIQKFKAQATAWATDAEFKDTPLSTPSAPPSRLWSAVPGSTSPRRASTSTAPMSPFPVSSSPSDGGNVEMDEPNAIPDTDTDLDMDMDMGADADDGEEDTDALRRVVSSSSASASTARGTHASAFLRPSNAIENSAEAEGQEEEGKLTESQLSCLTHVLERSALYSSILERQMREARAARAHVCQRQGRQRGFEGGGENICGEGEGEGRGEKGATRRRVEEEEEEEGTSRLLYLFPTFGARLWTLWLSVRVAAATAAVASVAVVGLPLGCASSAYIVGYVPGVSNSSFFFLPPFLCLPAFTAAAAAALDTPPNAETGANAEQNPRTQPQHSPNPT
ncbi:hypothetical protein B0H16DRAFT_1905295 [Mycena metata]|uniref:Transmembrane protein n=1 Tax=Mycena metata TaxID=1033252 RepID=A0AAD7GI53_9AGAR|nr:hypothetical protein B0H16DRAFT_1905295 [Mycena metata]